MTDALLDTAITNWEPRFSANGVDPSDYRRITGSLETWKGWCAAWSRAADDHVRLGEAALNSDRFLSAGESFARAATYFHFAQFLFVHDLAQAREAHALAVATLTRALPLLAPSGRRETIAFADSTLVGILRTPAGTGPHPTVILIAGLDSTKEEFREVERAFLDRGMATFSLDGPGQGEVGWTTPITPAWEHVAETVYDHLSGLTEVDAARVGVWGVSLGGYYAARAAASDAPFAAVVALSGPYDFGAHFASLNPLTRLAFEVRSGSASADEAARRASTLTLEDHAARIHCPLLVIAGERDRLFPVSDARRLAAEVAGPVELLVLESGNHGCANVIYRHRPYSADWMAERLGLPLAHPTPEGVLHG